MNQRHQRPHESKLSRLQQEREYYNMPRARNKHIMERTHARISTRTSTRTCTHIHVHTHAHLPQTSHTHISPKIDQCCACTCTPHTHPHAYAPMRKDIHANMNYIFLYHTAVDRQRGTFECLHRSKGTHGQRRRLFVCHVLWLF